jgi:hypothetical protein
MLTEQEIVDAFMSRVNEHPGEILIQAYQELSIDQLHEILDRRVAIENNVDPTYTQRLQENYQAWLAATPEQRINWVRVRPIIPT